VSVDRSSLAEVRNPILALPAFDQVRALTPDARQALRAVLSDIAADARLRAEKCWRTHKAPMALYWKCVAVYSGHIARAIGRKPATARPLNLGPCLDTSQDALSHNPETLSSRRPDSQAIRPVAVGVPHNASEVSQ
jgi:hypothetical protein